VSPVATQMPELRITIPERLEQKLQSAMPDYLDRKSFVCLLIDRALDTPDTLAEGATAPLPRGGGAIATEASKPSTSSSKKENTKLLSIRLIPVSLEAHDDLIRAFWKAKAGAKTDAGWKLLMTELAKIQDKYGDRVVREQLELAAASRWKGISLRNYEQFGLQASRQASRGEKSIAELGAEMDAMPSLW